MTAPLQIGVHRSDHPVDDDRRRSILDAPGFGRYFTDHMLTATWTPDAGWHDARVQAYGPFALDPASAVLHYAQEVFEGLKAYRHADGSVWTFRPQVNAARFRDSAARMALPELPEDDFVRAVDTLVDVDQAWVPTGGETSLYLRPFMFASEVFLGVRPAKHVTLCVIASPAGSYFAGGVQPVRIWLSEEFTRAAPGGTGAAKCGGNYAASLLAQQEALAHGCDQVVFLDAVDRTWVEELGGMNLFFVHRDGHIVTPALTGSILAGVTRSSILELADALGHKVEERQVSVDEWRDGIAAGDITEVFACGTAAVLTPVGTLVWRSGEVSSPVDGAGPVTARIRGELLDIQYGRVEDAHGWMHRIC
ncbi:MAG: branched-chain amino acid aminotransferase [Actinomycetota bacterium]|nr:branched-chain amino acid aminotransferase [Actinomycetota bacterium]